MEIMIAKHTGGGSIQFSLSGMVSLVTVVSVIVGVGLYVGSYVENIGANAQEVIEIKSTVDEFRSDVRSFDRRLVQVETTAHSIQAQQIGMQKSLQQTRETQSAIVANQKSLHEKIDGLNDGVQDIQRLLRNLQPR